MKRVLVILAIIILMVTAFVILDFRQYKLALNTMSEIEARMPYYSIATDYYENYGKLPVNINDIKKYMVEMKYDSLMFSEYFADPFLKDSSLVYIPRYNHNQIITGFLLLSRGPDKKLNNLLSSYTHSVYALNNLKLYNKRYAIEYFDILTSNYFNIPYSPFARCFGNKDIYIIACTLQNYFSLQIMSYDWVKEASNNKQTIDYLIDRYLTENIKNANRKTKSVIPVKISDSVSYTINKDSTIHIEESNYHFICAFGKGLFSIPDIKNERYTILAGRLDSIDVENKTFYLKHCLYLDN